MRGQCRRTSGGLQRSRKTEEDAGGQAAHHTVSHSSLRPLPLPFAVCCKPQLYRSPVPFASIKSHNKADIFPVLLFFFFFLPRNLPEYSM